MQNKNQNTQEDAPRFERITSKTAEFIKSHTGKKFEVSSEFAIDNLIDELPKNWQPSDVHEKLEDLQNFFHEVDPGDISARQFQGYQAVIALAKHYFRNLISNNPNE